MPRVWPALLIVHVAWSAHLVVSYYLAWAACGAGDDWRLAALRHLTTLIALGMALAASWQAYRVSQSAVGTIGERREQHEAVLEHVLLARMTIVLSAIYLFAIVMAGSANLFFDACV
jgi:hypothetical protein